ncbi:DNA-formamidopyrimidine glycosylase family protein [Acidicapsa acidisoli]|uniref:DNA-formamidopyrimidine glycosylase family protein n=1 Tax=Acidicapsa acidisoli TaxID=1615681 RepID=UPI0021E03635|nr:DNA-formamidopyrimidine glycosylase family protein [Acidicapsa acidisoli]
MPEGDTIFRTARALGRALTGKPITRFTTEYAQLARANDDHPFVGQTITQVEARGKWLLIHFSGSGETPGAILATHMLMSGSWHIYRPGERWQQPHSNARIIIETADYLAVGFRIPVARMHTPESLTRDRKIPQPASDVLKEEFNASAAMERLKAHPNEEIAEALLRQNVLAGVGNVFKSEICFLEGLSPFQKVATLSDRQLEKLVATACRLMAANVLEDSGDTIATYSGKNRRTTGNADPGENLWVYRRNGEPCRRCGEPIQRCLQGKNARSTYWCPICQPLT